VAATPVLLRIDAARGLLVSVFAIAAAFVLLGLAGWRRSAAGENPHAATV
jgi:hypothetical protein